MKKARESCASDVRRRVRIDDLVSVHGLPSTWWVERTYSAGPRDGQQTLYVLRNPERRRVVAVRSDFTRVYWSGDDSGALVTVEPA